MAEADRVRAFLAIPPDPGWVESARALTGRLRPELPEASWTRPESWHLTLRFLGELSRDRLASFGSAVGYAAGRLAAAKLVASGPLVFPPRGPARVLSVGFEANAGAEALAARAGAAESAAQAAGLAPERRPFHPHVTLARLRRVWPAEALERFRSTAKAWTFPVWTARSCVLYESRLRPEGAVHSPIAEWGLSAPQGRIA